MPRLAKLGTALVAAAALLPAVDAAAAGDAANVVPTALERCSLAGQDRRLGPTYVTSLRVENVGCATAKRLVRAYYSCRVRNGGRKGTCRSTVLGYRCRETRLDAIETQFDATVRCTRGSRKVNHSYTQFT
ncbi:MAG: hypothetical protein QOD55_554 [Solirubrobacteraceae bacterium]|jgi:hypothetical protein|nr:hypothetical protein [Solirubrobacteraceae bacterium]MEA2288557.1 hypothetical protein [Solirubrobacteraceae bacterium]